MLAIKGGKMITMGKERGAKPLKDGVILIDKGKIKEVGEGIAIPKGAEIIDGHGKWICPGFIDAHTHISTFGEPQTLRGRPDGNEMTQPVTAHIRGLDALNPFDPAIAEVRSAGFTTCYTGPGSGNVICGTGVAFKLRGKTVDEMVIPGTEQMKMALGENPKTVYGERQQAPMTRMGTAGILRETLANARDYMRQLDTGAKNPDKMPKHDFKLDALVKLMRGEMKARIHCHRNDDIVTAVRVAREFGLDFALEHATEGYMIADYLAKEGVTCVVGPLLLGPEKMELWNATPKNPGILDAAGVTVCLTQDDGSATKWLPMQIGVCMAYGLSEAAAFKGVTVNPAKLLGIEEQTGSLEAGKDADIAIFNGNPFSNMTRCVMTLIDGVVYQGAQ